MNNQPFQPPKRSFDLSQVKYLVDLSGKEAPRLIDTGNLKMSKFDADHQFGIAVSELPEEVLRDFESGEDG